MQTSRPDKLVVLATIPGNVTLERGIHERFQPYRLKGEWFSPAEEILDFLRTRVTPRDVSQNVSCHEKDAVTPSRAVPSRAVPSLKDLPAPEVAGELPGDPTLASPPAPPALKAKKPEPPPLPFKVDEALAALAQGGGFVASKPNKGQAILTVKLIRSHPDLETWRLVGEWLPKGREAWRCPLDTRSIGDFEAWVAHALAWKEAGRPEMKPRGGVIPMRRGQSPLPEGY